MSTQPRTFVFLRPTLTVRSPSHRPPNPMPPACDPRTLLFDITTLPPQFARSARPISVADKTSLHPLSCLPHRHHHHLLVSSARCFASSLFLLESGRWSRRPGVSHWDEEEEGMVMVGGRGEELGLQQMSAVHRDGGGRRPPLVPLATLIGRELRAGGGVGGGGDRPSVRYGQAALAKRGEDYFLTKPDCFRVHGDPSSSFSVFAIFDGHNGISAAVFTKEHLLDHVMSAMEPGIGREEWLQALPRALVAGFVKTDIEFQRKGEASGTTATLVVIDGWTVTVASVGDSRCILDSRGVVTLLTVDHRLEENVEERERVTASGGEVGRLNICGGQEVGPLRCWPGGLCLSRSIGDMDVGEFIVPIPHVKQVKLSNAGGRLIIASDGIWDSLSSEVAAMCCRGLPTELAAKLVVKEALRTTGLKDDTTCLVVDIIPSNHSSAPATPKNNQNKLRSIIFGKRSHSTNKLSDGAVEEIFEEGSAILAERLGAEHSARSNSGPVRCAICQVDQTPNNGLSIKGGGSYILHSSKHWEGPLLCAECQKKKDAMEGKRSNRQMITS